MTARDFLHKKNKLSTEKFFAKEEVLLLLDQFAAEVRNEEVNTQIPLPPHNKRAFEDWLKTESGVKCNDFIRLTGQPYLENRLWWAFNAGMTIAKKK